MSPLDRDELAARFAVAAFGGAWADPSIRKFDDDNMAKQAYRMADALLARLAPAPVVDAPRAPYVPKVGDVVAFQMFPHRYVVTRTAPKLGGKFCQEGVWKEWYGGDPSSYTYTGPATAAERAAAGLPPEAGVVASVPSVPTHKDAAPASVPTPAIDPRRTVGAVVRNTPNGSTFIVVESGEGAHKQRASWVSKDCITLPTHSSDEFARWATLDECRQHGIPYVDRTAPASKPVDRSVDREGLARALRAAEFAHDAHLLSLYPWETLPPACRDNYLSRADAAIKFIGGAS